MLGKEDVLPASRAQQAWDAANHAYSREVRDPAMSSLPTMLIKYGWIAKSKHSFKFHPPRGCRLPKSWVRS
jgi:hypothetical protein